MDYEVSVYCAPDDSSGRTVIRGVDLRLDRDNIQAELQDNRNPPIADFQRLGNTTAVLIASVIELTFALAELRNAGSVIYQTRQTTTRANQPVACAANNTSRAIVAANKSTGSPTRSSAGSGRSTDKPRNTESRYKSPPSKVRSTTPADGIGNAPEAGRGSLETARTPFHRSSLPLTRGDLGLPPGTDTGHLQSFSSLELLLFLCAISTFARPTRTSTTGEYAGTPSTPDTHEAIVELTAVIQLLTLRVEALEVRTASHNPSPPIPQLPPTVEPMDVAPSSAPTHKRKALADNDPKAENWQTRLDRLEKKTRTHTHSHHGSIEGHIEHSLHTIGFQVSQQIQTLSIEPQGKPLAVAELAAAQWNCRGFARKRPVLRQFFTASDRPELIALQEEGKHTRLAAEELAQRQPLLIVGDFNAHHRAWGYHYDSAKGRRL
ncbi:hypothetical protein HPB50_015503 [Hyalomma asiaticum]|uniref:Uncharacterized protein n=1 Tax=Hyalomma asiaticum TaxID=266040 RepID=A0ACB7S1B7_HYAAI|nr:hypothetical protein HPB50_015503 [Hyalomma asiaticum]